MLRVGLSYSMNNRFYEYNSGESYKNTNHSFGISFGTTRYFTISDKLYFTIATSIIPSYSINHAQQESSNRFNVVNDKTNNVSGSLAIDPGLTYFLNKKWMVYASMRGANYEVNYRIESKDLSHNLDIRLSANSFGIGVRYILGTKNVSNK